jgi:glyoxylase-like metal-dependent hydrolase (beta-lactamase superfamily II)
LQVLDSPGHTPGHLSYLLSDQGILFAGDSIVNRGRKLRPNFSLFTGDLDREIQSFAMQAGLYPNCVLTGHACIETDAAA